MKQAYMETFGCQMNVADTDRMELLLFQSGYLRTPHVEDADLVQVNTCSIREKAEQKVFSLFGGFKPLKQSNPDLILGVAGCLAQQEQDLDAVVGEELERASPTAVRVDAEEILDHPAPQGPVDPVSSHPCCHGKAETSPQIYVLNRMLADGHDQLLDRWAGREPCTSSAAVGASW